VSLFVFLGPCPETRDNVDVPATGSTLITINTCPATDSLPRPLSPSNWANLTVFRLNGLSFIKCNGTGSQNINVTGDRLGVIAETGVVDAGASSMRAKGVRGARDLRTRCVCLQESSMWSHST
jgi:hypothetical protein